MAVAAAVIHLIPWSSWTSNKKRLAVVQRRLLLLSPSVSSSSGSINNSSLLLLNCIPPGPIQMELELEEDGIVCDCNGKGWLICDFCGGQKTNVKATNNRLYRRCPSCKAIGYILCPKCKVFKCVTFPNDPDNGDGSETG